MQVFAIICLFAMILSAAMLICSVNIRKINPKRWSFVLVFALICSLSGYEASKIITSKKRAPEIDFSNITPEKKEEIKTGDTFVADDDENLPAKSYDTDKNTVDGGSGDAAKNEYSDSEDAFNPQSNTSENMSEQNSAEQKPSAQAEVKPLPESPSVPSAPQADAFSEPQVQSAPVPDSEYPAYEAQNAPEIEYEGPFRLDN